MWSVLKFSSSPSGPHEPTPSKSSKKGFCVPRGLLFLTRGTISRPMRRTSINNVMIKGKLIDPGRLKFVLNLHSACKGKLVVTIPTPYHQSMTASSIPLSPCHLYWTSLVYHLYTIHLWLYPSFNSSTQTGHLSVHSITHIIYYNHLNRFIVYLKENKILNSLSIVIDTDIERLKWETLLMLYWMREFRV